MTTCQSCGKPILPGQRQGEWDHVSSSGGGLTFYYHRDGCTRPAPQGVQEQPIFLPDPDDSPSRPRRRPRR